MKTNIIILALLITACSSEPSYNNNDTSALDAVESVDSLEEMMAFINYVDSAGVVEKVSNDFVELKETNEQLETTLEETKQELETTKDVLVQTRVKLEKTENIVKAIVGDDANNDSGFELLPIQK
jgi:hypothetical protein